MASVSRSCRRITQPCLVVNGVFDTMIPVRNSYFLAEHLPNATLLVYPDAGHGSLFQFHDSFRAAGDAVPGLVISPQSSARAGWPAPHSGRSSARIP